MQKNVRYTIDLDAKTTQIVGILPEVIVVRYNLLCSSREVKMFPGAIKHIKKRHPGILESFGHLIPEIIEFPDYVGQSPRHPNSVELIKVVSEHLLLAIKLDPSGYLFVSSFYELNNGPYKIKKRLRSGRLVRFTDLLDFTI